MSYAFKDALLEAARECGFWFDPARQRPAVLLDGVPVALPLPRKDGECSRAVHSSTRGAVTGYKQRTIEAFAPSPGVGSRRLRHYFDLLARQTDHLDPNDPAAPLRMAKESGALALAWRLAEVPEACQRPCQSLLERAFETWIAEQEPDASGNIIVRERQTRIDLERIAGEDVPLRAVRKLAEWYGFRRIHARRARLLIRP